jgi:tetratricopeptide (TPR) repeat protein
MARPVPSPAPAPWRRIVLPVLIAVAVFVAYWPVRHGAALWDDDGHITKPELRSLDGLRRIWTEPGAAQQYYPVLHTAFWLEHRLWGDATTGYHLLNAGLHAVSAILLVHLLRRLGVGGADFAGLLFALHPVAVESVAWITEQKNTLSLALALAAAVVYLGAPDPASGACWRRGRYWAATALYLLAVLAKTMVAPLPAVLLVLAWWREGRLERKSLVPLAPWFLCGVTLGLFTAWMEHSVIGAQGAEYALTFFQRLMLAARALWFYAGKVVWPGTLMFFYPRWDVPAAAAGWWPWLLATMVLGAALAWWARRDRGPLAAALIYAGLLFPALGFFNVFPFRFSYVADHFQYPALAAAAACLGAVAARLTAAWPTAVRAAGAALVLAAAAGQVWRQAGTYVDNETLWRTTTERNPTSWLARNDLGQAILDAGRAEESLAHFAAALALDPGKAPPENNYALALAAAGRVEEAAAHYRRALELAPDYADARANYGGLLAGTGNAAAAVEQLARAVALRPDEPRYRYNLALALRADGRAADSERELRETLRLDPRRAEAWNALGYVLDATGRGNEAVPCFQTALQLRPDFTNARVNLGVAWLGQRRWAEAAAAFAEALRAEPDNAGVHFNLAVALRQLGRADEAAVHEARSRELRASPR